jgi:hypothetical protein
MKRGMRETKYSMVGETKSTSLSTLEQSSQEAWGLSIACAVFISFSISDTLSSFGIPFASFCASFLSLGEQLPSPFPLVELLLLLPISISPIPIVLSNTSTGERNVNSWKEDGSERADEGDKENDGGGDDEVEEEEGKADELKGNKSDRWGRPLKPSKGKLLFFGEFHIPSTTPSVFVPTESKSSSRPLSSSLLVLLSVSHAKPVPHLRNINVYAMMEPVAKREGLELRWFT